MPPPTMRILENDGDTFVNIEDDPDAIPEFEKEDNEEAQRERKQGSATCTHV